MFTWTKHQTSLLAARDTALIIRVIGETEYLFHNVYSSAIIIVGVNNDLFYTSDFIQNKTKHFRLRLSYEVSSDS